MFNLGGGCFCLLLYTAGKWCVEQKHNKHIPTDFIEEYEVIDSGGWRSPCAIVQLGPCQ